MKFFIKKWPILLILLVWGTLFFPLLSKGLLPIPADIIAGVYYPWLDYKWGFPVGVPVKNPLISDIPSLLFPWRMLVINQYQKIAWPLWNPYYFSGMPLMANFQSAAFSYVNVLFLFLPKVLAWSFGIALSPLLTMIAVYLFLRNKKLGAISSLLGSVVFSLSGFQIAWLEYNVHGHTALFLPLILLFIDKILGERKRGFLLCLPFLVAFQIFAGYIPIVIYTYLICGLYVLFFYFLPWITRKSFEWKNFLLFLVFFLWGIALAAVQLLPGFELTQNSIRKIDPIVSASGASYLPLVNAITAIAPDFFGNPATGNYFGKAFYDNFYFFAGTGVLILLLFSLSFVKKERNILFWWITLTFSLLLIFENPIGKLLEKILFLSGGVSARALFITVFCLAVLSAYGLEKLLSVSKTKKNLTRAILAILAFFGVAFIFAGKIGNQVFQHVAGRNLIVPFMVFILSAVCLFSLTVNKLRKFKPIFALAFFIITSLQLLYSAYKYLPFSKSELIFPQTPILEFLVSKQEEESGPFRVELGEVVPQNFLMPYGLETTSGYDALLPKTTAEFLSILESGEVKEHLSRVWLIKNYDSPLFPLLNTKYIIAKKTDELGKFSPEGNPPSVFSSSRYRMVFEDKTVQIYEDSNFLPRAFWVYDYEVAQNEKEFIAKASKTDFSKTVILENDPGLELKEATQSSVLWEEYRPGKIVLRVLSDQPGLVFLSNSYFPGWEAKVGSKNAALLRTNHAFVSVYVPAGEHQITLDYRPKFFYQGLFISLCSLILLAAVSALAVFITSINFLKKKNV